MGIVASIVSVAVASSLLIGKPVVNDVGLEFIVLKLPPLVVASATVKTELLLKYLFVLLPFVTKKLTDNFVPAQNGPVPLIVGTLIVCADTWAASSNRNIKNP